MELADVLLQAMKLEVDGKAFYLESAERSTDPETAEVYRTLANDEDNHYSYIKRQYEALQAGEGWSPIPEMEKIEEFDSVSLVFPSGKKALETLPDDASEEDAMIFALSIEDKSFKIYYDSSERAKDPDAKQLFLQLASAERTHFNVLMQRYESRFGYPR